MRVRFPSAALRFGDFQKDVCVLCVDVFFALRLREMLDVALDGIVIGELDGSQVGRRLGAHRAAGLDLADLHRGDLNGSAEAACRLGREIVHIQRRT